jgi:hypothetical protein
LLDWAFVGSGAIGEDIGNLIPDAAFDHFISSSRLVELDEAVCEAFLRGLRDAGWSGDERIVRLGVLASAVKYVWLTPLMLAQAANAVQHLYGGSGEIDAEFRFRERGEALLFNARRALAALDLAREVGLR